MKPFALSLIAAVTVSLSTSRAVDYNWDGSADTNWMTGANWTPVGPPTGGAGDFARFLAPGPNQPTISTNVPDVEGYLTGAGGIVITQTAGIANQTGQMQMGALSPPSASNVGTYNLSGGTLQARSFRITESPGQVATINVSGNGIFRQSDVTPTDATQWALLGANGTANVNLSDSGMMSFDSRVILGSGSGAVNVTQTGGTFQVRRGEFNLGDSFTAFSPTPTANYNISAGTLSVISPLNSDDTGANIIVGQWANANSRLTVSGTATVRANRDLLIADVDPTPANANASARGEIVQSGGAVSYGRQFIAGRLRSGANFGNGFYTMSGGTLTQDAVNPDIQTSWNHIGQSGTGTFTISDGTVSFNARTLLAGGTGGIGLVTQSGGLFEVRNQELVIGELGTGTFDISNGTVKTFGIRPINVGGSTNSVGNLNVSGTGEVITGGDLNLGHAGTNPRGTVTQTGGTVTVNGNLALANVAGSTGTYNLGGGVLDLTAGNINHGPGVFAFFFTGGRLRNAATINLPIMQQGGVLAPGPDGGVGSTTINGTYSLSAAGTIEINLELASFDQLIATGGVSLAGTLDLVPGPGLMNGQSFVVVSNTSANPILGAFAGRPDDTQFIEDGQVWSIDYQGGDGNDVLVTYVIPEPASTGLLIAGLLGPALLRRRRQRPSAIEAAVIG